MPAYFGKSIYCLALNNRKVSEMAPDTQMTYWAEDATSLIARLKSRREGLSSEEAAGRLRSHGANTVDDGKGAGPIRLLGRQFESPLVLVLIFGAALSFILRQWTDAGIILAIVVTSALLGFYQEYKASTALLELRQRLAQTAKVMRDGKIISLPATHIVPGDIIQLSAGNLVPADGLVLTATDFLVTEASLTGESMPVEKRPRAVAADAPIGRRTNCAFSGTSVRSGLATILVVHTGAETALGDVARSIAATEPETEFARGIRQFGYLLVKVMIVMVLFVLTVSQLMGRPLIESLLFAVALAVGMTPELLPAIVTVTLSAGARAMAKQGVIVRRLEALENLGSMNVLCTDKTGTLTEGTVTLAAALDIDSLESADVRHYAYLNSVFETGIENPIDQAIVEAGQKTGLTIADYVKIDEIPYDFVRKRLTIVVQNGQNPKSRLIITKGSFKAILAVCSYARIGGRDTLLNTTTKNRLQALLDKYGNDGFRVLAVATRDAPTQPDYDIKDERDMVFAGFLLLADPPKAESKKAVADLSALGIRLKIITGDNQQVTVHVAKAIGLGARNILTGPEISLMKDEALAVRADKADLFVEIDPQQKERIILALQKRGHAVGYMGDGINDAPALHAADVGISVDQAVDVARQSADLVLLKRDLDVLRLGVESGRRTFANTLKYISITTSANFGNMISMALVTPFLPFLPLFAKQILLNNFLSDIPSIAISKDNVDAELAQNAERWDVREVKRFMIVFGLVSSVFDLITFTLLLKFYVAGEAEFQTAWFVVSLLTETAVVFSLRTRRLVIRSRPSTPLMLVTLVISVVAVAIPYIGPLARLFGFVPLPAPVIVSLLLIVLGYILATEATKHRFYKA
jgi:Mg2+-importing ATPase